MNPNWNGRLAGLTTTTCLAVLVAFGLPGEGGQTAAWRIEAEQAGDGDVQKVVTGITKEGFRWKVLQADDASGGAYVGGTLVEETKPAACRIPRAGSYRVWVRHYQTPGKPTSFFMLWRDDLHESVGLRNLDWYPRSRCLTALPPPPLPAASKSAKPVWAWSSCEIRFERPMEAAFSFGSGGGLTTGQVGIDCVVVTDDFAFDPAAGDWMKLPADAGPFDAIRPPAGMQPALPLTLHASFFAGAPDREDQIKLCMVHGYTLYRDFPWLLQLGFNRDRGWNGGSAKYGIQTQINPHVGYEVVELYRQTHSPTGRRVNAAGVVNEKRFSKSYEPYRQAVLQELRAETALFQTVDEAERYAVTGESGGVFDYSEYARDRFHRWLEERFGSIDTLNERWRSAYRRFNEVPLPKQPAPGENKAAWFAFREFCGLTEAIHVADEIRVINQADPRHLPATSQGSCLHINSPGFTSTGSIDFEDMINVGFAESPMFGYDAYSSEDYFIGCDAEFLLSLAGKRDLLNGEGNFHAADPRIAARSYWCMIGKGLKGIDMWQLQDHPVNPVYTMWGMLNPDMTPRDRLAAVSDANHEIHRLERILRHARRAEYVKPVALYYSRMDLSLTQPLFDIYGSAIDSPYRIYAVLRGLGYPVRWITPRQIEAGRLEDVSAVVLVGVKYVPQRAAARLAEWVRAGGCVIGDQWPGAFDEYDRQQGTLAQVFGIRADDADVQAPLAPDQARLALEEAATPVYGLDANLLKSLAADEFYKSVDEMFEQRDSQHPVARAVRNWHLSGYDGKNIKVVAGEVIGSMMGRPGLVINAHGKGHALYSAIMLGTLHEAGPIRFEWDSSREGPALGNILDAFLRFSGVRSFAEPEMPWGLSRKMRIELPLVDAKNNVLIGMISVNDGPLAPFRLALAWPGTAPVPKTVLVCVGGSRRLEQTPFAIEDGRLRLTMPGFDTHATLLAIMDSDPLVSLECTGVARKIAGLLEMTPNARLRVKATVWNPSPRKLAAGTLRLHAAPGWFADRAEVEVDAIEPWGCYAAAFEVRPPALCGSRTLKPLVFRYESGKTTSTPATELVWWTPAGPPAEPSAPDTPRLR